METRANHLLIGVFVIALMIGCFNFIFWMKTTNPDQSSRDYLIYFNGAVTGLNKSSQVLFNGVRIGRVTDININEADSRQVRVKVRLNAEIPIRRNSEAQLSQQALTGVAGIQITPGTPDEPLVTAMTAKGLPIIKAAPIASSSLTQAAPELLGKANILLTRLNSLIGNNEDSIRRSVKNIENFTGVLDQHKGDFSEIVKNAKQISSRFKATADKIDETVDKFSGFFGGEGDSFIKDAQEAARSIRDLAKKLDGSLGSGTTEIIALAKRSLREFELFARDGRKAAQSLDRVLDKLDQNPESIIFGGGPVPEYSPN